MFKLVIYKSRSKNFNKVVEIATELGGNFDGEKITIETEESLAYSTLFSLFKYNVLTWSGTKAYADEKEVHPYRYIFKRDLIFRKNTKELIESIDFTFPKTYTYYKREGNTFYFKNEYIRFDVTLKGKDLFEFVDEYSIGDEIYLENPPSYKLNP